MRMLDKDPERRPRSAASLARMMDAMLERTPPGGVPMVPGRHATGVQRRPSSTEDHLVPSTGGFAVEPGPPSFAPGPQPRPPVGIHQVGVLETAVVPGRAVEQAIAPLPSEPPPRFTPPPGTRRHLPPVAAPNRSWRDLRSRRWFGVPAQAVVLALLVLCALLGAAVAATLWGSHDATTGSAAGERPHLSVTASHRAGSPGGMIEDDLDRGSRRVQQMMTVRDL
jgi:serine/threonine-protein kinase